MEQELANSSQSLDTKLEQLLEESAKRATEAGTIDESTVRHIAKGLVKEAVSELNSSLEGIIGHMDTSLAQLKVDQPVLYYTLYIRYCIVHVYIVEKTSIHVYIPCCVHVHMSLCVVQVMCLYVFVCCTCIHFHRVNWLLI